MEEARKQANLRLLQRTCSPDTNDILASATHAVLYEFDTKQQNWTKCQCEGSLFIAVANDNQTVKQFSIIILNRSSSENFQLQVQPNFQLQHQDDYLILRLSDRILGIWFPSAEERMTAYNILLTVVSSLKQKFQQQQETNLQRQNHQEQQPRSVSAPQSTVPVSTEASLDATATALAAVHLKSALGIGTATLETSTAQEASFVPPETSPSAPTLDKKSLQLALLSLIQDERFLDLLHSQYLRVARSRAKKNQGNDENEADDFVKRPNHFSKS